MFIYFLVSTFTGSLGGYNLRNCFECDNHVNIESVCYSMEVLLILAILHHNFSNRSIVIFDQLLQRYNHYTCPRCRPNRFDSFVFVLSNEVEFRGSAVVRFGNSLGFVLNGTQFNLKIGTTHQIASALSYSLYPLPSQSCVLPCMTGNGRAHMLKR